MITEDMKVVDIVATDEFCVRYVSVHNGTTQRDSAVQI